MSLEADRIVGELKKLEFDKLYDKHNIEISQVVPKPSERQQQYYIHTWALGHTREGDYILDAGCGDGALSYILKQSGRNPVGVDISPETVKLATTNVPGVKFNVMYLERLEFQDNFFDCIVSCQVLEHIINPEIVIKEMLRVLKPEGKLIITVPIQYNLDTGQGHHLQHWGLYEIKDLFEKYGSDFKIYWLNKFKHFEDNGVPTQKNCFGIIYIKHEVK